MPTVERGGHRASARASRARARSRRVIDRLGSCRKGHHEGSCAVSCARQSGHVKRVRFASVPKLSQGPCASESLGSRHDFDHGTSKAASSRGAVALDHGRERGWVFEPDDRSRVRLHRPVRRSRRADIPRKTHAQHVGVRFWLFECGQVTDARDRAPLLRAATSGYARSQAALGISSSARDVLLRWTSTRRVDDDRLQQGCERGVAAETMERAKRFEEHELDQVRLDRRRDRRSASAGDMLRQYSRGYRCRTHRRSRHGSPARLVADVHGSVIVPPQQWEQHAEQKQTDSSRRIPRDRRAQPPGEALCRHDRHASLTR